jgi:hypothetical protein
MTDDAQAHWGEGQARRLEDAARQISMLVQRTENGERLRAARTAEDWTVLQTLGHCNEMIPYWLGQCRLLIDVSGADRPHFGRGADDPGRLAGPASGAVADPAELLAQLQAQAWRSAAAIRTLTVAESAQTGIHARAGEMRVQDIVERFIVVHAEEHERQIRELLGA